MGRGSRQDQAISFSNPLRLGRKEGDKKKPRPDYRSAEERAAAAPSMADKFTMSTISR